MPRYLPSLAHQETLISITLLVEAKHHLISKKNYTASILCIASSALIVQRGVIMVTY